jgi:hypothetical protein
MVVMSMDRTDLGNWELEAGLRISPEFEKIDLVKI